MSNVSMSTHVQRFASDIHPSNRFALDSCLELHKIKPQALHSVLHTYCADKHKNTCAESIHLCVQACIPTSKRMVAVAVGSCIHYHVAGLKLDFMSLSSMVASGLVQLCPYLFKNFSCQACQAQIHLKGFQASHRD